MAELQAADPAALGGDGADVNTVTEAAKETAARATKKKSRGRPKKRDPKEEYRRVLEQACAGINALVKAKAPEFVMVEDEVTVFAGLGAAVLDKHVDDAVSRYTEEIMLGTFVVAAVADKAQRYAERRKTERAAADASGIPDGGDRPAEGRGGGNG